jgi:hypothetical protein
VQAKTAAAGLPLGAMRMIEEFCFDKALINDY